MSPRINLAAAVGQKALQPMYALEEYMKSSSLGHRLIHLVKIRASQINGCAYCLHMHTSDTLAEGEDAARIFLLDAWRESHLYSERERAALAWTEALTNISQTHAPDADFEALKAQFNEQEIMDLTLLVATINSWNRLAIGMRAEHPHDVKRKAVAA
jgi:AhpD family alkylhydroperoxidase